MIKAIDSAVRPRQQVMDATIEGEEGPSCLSSSIQRTSGFAPSEERYNIISQINLSKASVLLTSGNSNVGNQCKKVSSR